MMKSWEADYLVLILCSATYEVAKLFDFFDALITSFV